MTRTATFFTMLLVLAVAAMPAIYAGAALA